MIKDEWKARRNLNIYTVSVIAILTAPLIMALSVGISATLFTILTIVGIVLGTGYIILALVSNIVIQQLKGAPKTKLKKTVDRQASLLFVVIFVIQFVNTMFIHFE